MEAQSFEFSADVYLDAGTKKVRGWVNAISHEDATMRTLAVLKKKYENSPVHFNYMTCEDELMELIP
jgi:hypothetical protein